MSRVQLAETAAWLDILYGKCHEGDGSLVIVASSRNRPVGIFPVGRGADLVAAAKEMQRHPGCYAKINLMDESAMRDRAARTRKPVVGARAEVKTIVSIHLDVDAGKGGKYVSRGHALWALDNMPRPPTLVVNSNGKAGGFHAYWVLSQPHRLTNDRERVQKIADAWRLQLKERLGGKLDATSNIDRVLRCVGVPRLDGGMVCCESYEAERIYRLEDFQQ